MHERLFCLEQRALCIHHGEVIDPAVAVLQVEQRVCCTGAAHLCLGGPQLLAPGGATRQSIGHFAEGYSDRFAVLRGGNLPVDFRHIEVSLVGAEIEDRHGDLRGE
ncbi:hypothetical protein D9M69_637130 [compost metagenome]